MNKSIEIVLLDITSIDDQLKIHQAAFGAEGISVDKDYWIKKHYKNPLGRSLIFGARIDGVVVGMNAYMPMEYYFGDETYHLLQSCESGVLPQFQGKGIWGKIVRYAIDYIAKNTKYEAVIGFPNYSKSYPGFKKMGWLTVNEMENFVMVNNVSSFSKVIGSNSLFRKILSYGISIERLLLVGGADYSVAPCDELSMLWDNHKELVTRSHQPELIKWKIGYLGTKLLAVKKKNDVVASCIYHLDKYNDSTIIKIEKIVANGSISLRKAIIVVLKYFYTNYPYVAFIRLWTTRDSIIRPIIKKLLFIKSGHKNPFIISNRDNVLYNKCWDLSFYDLD